MLPSMAEPIQLTREIQVEVEAQRRIAEQRTRFEQAVFRLHAYIEEQKITPPECFISYAWGVPDHERWVEKRLATDLQKAGIDVVLDRWHNAQIGASVARFIERIEDCPTNHNGRHTLISAEAKNMDTKAAWSRQNSIYINVFSGLNHKSRPCCPFSSPEMNPLLSAFPAWPCLRRLQRRRTLFHHGLQSDPEYLRSSTHASRRGGSSRVPPPTRIHASRILTFCAFLWLKLLLLQHRRERDGAREGLSHLCGDFFTV